MKCVVHKIIVSFSPVVQRRETRLQLALNVSCQPGNFCAGTGLSVNDILFFFAHRLPRFTASDAVCAGRGQDDERKVEQCNSRAGEDVHSREQQK